MVGGRKVSIRKCGKREGEGRNTEHSAPPRRKSKKKKEGALKGERGSKREKEWRERRALDIKSAGGGSILGFLAQTSHSLT